MIPAVVAAEKRCTRCGLTQPLDHFSRGGHAPDGRHSQCQICKRAAWRAYVQRRPEMRSPASRPGRPAELADVDRAYRQWVGAGRPGAGVGAHCRGCLIPAGVGVPLKAADNLGAVRPDLEAIGVAFSPERRRYLCLVCATGQQP